MRSSLYNKPLWLLLGVQLAVLPLQAQDVMAYAAGKRSANGRQQEDSTKRQSATGKESLFKVLKDLNKTKGVFFLFSDQALGDKLVNPVKKEQADIEKILTQVLENTGLKYKKINDKTFVILAQKETSKTTLDLSQVSFASIDGTGTASPREVITGRVTDSAGTAVEGVSVTVKGTRKGTTTSSSGSFSIEANKGDVLVFSAVGYIAQEIAVGDQSSLTVSLVPSGSQMTEVVVTALGISRRSKSITYATQKVTGEELTTVKDPNLINSLNGKVAGLTINRSSSGAGGSVKVVMRGNKSTQNNSPLYVIDGIPMYNDALGQPENAFGQSNGQGTSGRDGGDAISNLNPEDIENIQVLKGASAAALYGSQAANGAILVTTKKGKAGATRITLTSSLTLDRVLLKPEAQFDYGQQNPGDENGWGAKNGTGDYTDDFYRTGTTWINGISMTAGSDKAQSYFSYSNTSNKNVLPNTDFNRHTFTFRGTAKFFNDKLSADGFVTLTKQKSTNRPVAGFYNNPQIGLYFFPRNLDFRNYKNNFEVFDPARLLNVHNWWNVSYDPANPRPGNEFSQNPYWILNRNTRSDGRERAFSSLTLKYTLTNWLSVQARGSYDAAVDDYDARMYASTNPTLADVNGRYIWEKSKDNIAYGDVLLFFNKDLNKDLSLNATVGASINDVRVRDRTFIDSYRAVDQYQTQKGLIIANVFDVQNIWSTNSIRQQSVVRYQTQSVLGSASLGYKDMIFLDLTARNDWSSTLAFTPNVSFLYYSAGATAVLSDLLKIGGPVDMGKIRVSYAKVGNSVRPFATHPPVYTVNPSTGALVKNVDVPFPGRSLKPEDNRSFEIGTEWRFLKNRLGIDVTFYKNDNYDQYFETPAPRGSGFNTYYLNLGHIRNTGVELMLTAVPVKLKNFEWNTSVNLAANNNKVVKLTEAGITAGYPQFDLTEFDNTYGTIVKEGGSFGDIISNMAQRDKSGNLLLNADGLPQRISEGENTAVVGNPNPDFTAGWSNTLRYKNFELNFLIDGRFGGEVMSLTQAELDIRGYSKASAEARENGGVLVRGIKDGASFEGRVDAQKYYNAIGGRAGIGEFYVYDATTIRMREVSLGYTIPVKWKGIRDLNVSLIGRNLFFIKREAPFDPEISMSTTNNLQGIDVFGLPATRSFGLNVKVGF